MVDAAKKRRARLAKLTPQVLSRIKTSLHRRFNSRLFIPGQPTLPHLTPLSLIPSIPVTPILGGDAVLLSIATTAGPNA